MRGRRHLALLACLALAPAACGGQKAGADSYTCGHLHHDVGAFRDQARLIIDRQGFKTSALSTEEAVLDVELQLRNACRGKADGYMPYGAVALAAPAD